MITITSEQILEGIIEHLARNLSLTEEDKKNLGPDTKLFKDGLKLGNTGLIALADFLHEEYNLPYKYLSKRFSELKEQNYNLQMLVHDIYSSLGK